MWSKVWNMVASSLLGGCIKRCQVTEVFWVVARPQNTVSFEENALYAQNDVVKHLPAAKP